MCPVEVDSGTTTQTETWPQVDRRRPGRPEHVSPELIPLMRGNIQATGEPEVLFGDPDQLRAVRGLAIGAVISCMLWMGLIFVASHLVP